MNVGEWVFKRAVTYPDGPFLKEEEERSFTNREFNERVNRMAHALAAWGVGRGERIAVLMTNTSEFLEIFFACAKTGAIMVPVNFRLAVPELAYILKDCAPRVLVYSADFAAKVGELKAALPGTMRFFRHGGARDGGRSRSWPRPWPPFPPRNRSPATEVTLADPLFIMYTSGTTGDPKGAVLTHGNVLFGSINTVVGCGINRSYRSLVVAPLFHIGALGASALPVLYAGGSLVLKGFYNASEVIGLICRERINYMFAVPVMFQLLTQTEEWETADFSHVHFFIAGGAPMPLAVIRKYQEEKGIFFSQGYGMTETFRLTSLDLEDSIRKAGSVGKEVLHVLLRIVDEQDRDVAPGEAGEIIVKGPNVFAGYWNKPAETAEAMRGGWFHTGDMGRRDEEGFIYYRRPEGGDDHQLRGEHLPGRGGAGHPGPAGGPGGGRRRDAGPEEGGGRGRLRACSRRGPQLTEEALLAAMQGPDRPFQDSQEGGLRRGFSPQFDGQDPQEGAEGEARHESRS